MEASGQLYLAAALPPKIGPAVPTENELHGAQCLNGYLGHVKQNRNLRINVTLRRVPVGLTLLPCKRKKYYLLCLDKLSSMQSA
jgi:hypothetical protein